MPVLSKQTVSTRPSASSVLEDLTRTPRRDSRRAAPACATVATRGSPSGTAATATETPAAIASRSGTFRSRPNPATPAPPRAVAGSAMCVISASLAWTPAAGAALPAARLARPACVDSPVATTTAYPDPASTVVPSKAMQVRSGTGAPGVASTSLSTGTDSPVSVDSSTSRSQAASSRASAGTTSDDCSAITSPGASRGAGALHAQRLELAPDRVGVALGVLMTSRTSGALASTRRALTVCSSMSWCSARSALRRAARR